eukprot:1306302-Pleurochrysis_carterae.AAC.1
MRKYTVSVDTGRDTRHWTTRTLGRLGGPAEPLVEAFLRRGSEQAPVLLESGEDVGEGALAAAEHEKNLRRRADDGRGRRHYPCQAGRRWNAPATQRFLWIKVIRGMRNCG